MSEALAVRAITSLRRPSQSSRYLGTFTRTSELAVLELDGRSKRKGTQLFNEGYYMENKVGKCTVRTAVRQHTNIGRKIPLFR